MILDEIAESVQKYFRTPIYRRMIEDILAACELTNDFWMLIRYSHQPTLIVSKTLEEFSKRGIISVKNGCVHLTERGRELLKKLGIGMRIYTCKNCEGRGIDEKLLEIVPEFVKIAKERPVPIQEYDQGYITVRCTLARVALMDQFNDLRGREIIVLGDDDLVSIAAALTGWPKRVVMVDIDERLIDFANKIADEYGLKLEAITLDLRKPLPDNYAKKFDTFVTDPPETVAGMRAFIGRGLSALKGVGCAGYFGLTTSDSSRWKWAQIQRVLLNEFGVVICAIIPDFNLYENWPYMEEIRGYKEAFVKTLPRDIWFTSAWIRIETLPGYKAFTEEIEGDIYFDEENAST